MSSSPEECLPPRYDRRCLSQPWDCNPPGGTRNVRIVAHSSLGNVFQLFHGFSPLLTIHQRVTKWNSTCHHIKSYTMTPRHKTPRHFALPHGRERPGCFLAPLRRSAIAAAALFWREPSVPWKRLAHLGRLNWPRSYRHVHGTYTLRIQIHVLWTLPGARARRCTCSPVHVWFHLTLAQWSTEVPLGRSALGVCPCGDPWGTLLQLETSYSRAPVKLPRGQTLRSTRPKVTSVLTRSRATRARYRAIDMPRCPFWGLKKGLIQKGRFDKHTLPHEQHGNWC